MYDEKSLADMSFETCASQSPVKVVKAKRKSLKKRKSLRKSLYEPTSSTTNKLKGKANTVKEDMKSSLSSQSTFTSKMSTRTCSSSAFKSTMSTRSSTRTFQSTVKPSQKKLTIPVAPVSHVSKRRESNFGNSLKSKSLDMTKLTKGRGKGAKSKMANGLTIPMPFKMGVSKRAKDTSSINEGCTSAELAQKFLKNPRSSTNLSTTSKHQCNKLTIPKSPSFKTSERAKVAVKAKPLSHVEKEEMEIEDASKHQFKARVMDKRIFNSMGEMGVPKVTSKKPTVPLDNHFESDRRASVRASLCPAPAAKEDDVETAVPFKARPMPNYKAFSFSSSRDEGDSAQRELTIPESPKFANSNGRRASSAPTRRQMPHHSVLEEKRQKAKAPKPQPKGRTQPQEFNLASNSRSDVYHTHFDQQVQREKEQEQLARERKALPLPSHRDTFAGRSSVCPIPLTEAQPFNLHSDGRHSIAQANFKQEREREKAEQGKAAKFHAKHTPSTTYQPHVIKPTDHKKVVPMAVSLQSTKRSCKRKEFDQSIAKKMAELQSIQETLVTEKENLENMAIRKLRSKPVAEGGYAFKATKVQKEDLYIAPAPKAVVLTEPVSPTLLSKNRTRQSLVDAL